MKRSIVLAVLALAACSTPPPPDPIPNVAVVPGARAPEPPRPPPPPPPPADACGASEVQHLVGRPRTEIPVPLRPNLQRVACNNCPLTMDYNQNRLNFFFDAGTGLITAIRCG